MGFHQGPNIMVFMLFVLQIRLLFCREMEVMGRATILAAATVSSHNQPPKENFLRILPDLPCECLVGFMESNPARGCEDPL